MNRRLVSGFGLVGTLLASAVGISDRAGAAPLGASFTYQGQLLDAGAPAHTDYDMRFTLHDAEVGGAQVGPIAERENVAVSNGLFTVVLSFGSDIFTGDTRWLEIGVRPGASSGSDPYTTLSPRQLLTAAPYALYAPAAGTASGLVCSGCVGAADLEAGAVQTSHLAPGAVTADRIANGTIQPAQLGFTPGTVTSVTAGTGLTGGTITASGIIAANIGTTPGTVAAGDHNHDAAYWKVAGNSGTTAGSTFLGTTDNQALEIKVNNRRALRLEPSTTSPNIIGGYSGNSVTASFGATIGGGGQSGAGSNNRVTDNYGTVGGGGGNQAGDGAGTTSDRNYATVAGGLQNAASGPYAAIGGGWGNVASGQLNCPGIFCVGNGTVGGGINNTASGALATIGGGAVNQASGDYATIAGGGTSDPNDSATGNRATGDYGTVGGGGNNSASARYTTIGGGNSNKVTDHNGTVSGGSSNQAGSTNLDPADAQSATVGGGGGNQATDGYATVGGGGSNTASSEYATVCGGSSNTASGRYATVAGGYDNEAVGLYATIAGGGRATAELATTRNQVTDDYGTVGGGGYNRAGDGAASTSNATYATVGGGYRNTASGQYATIPGGFNNTASGDYSFAAGRRATAAHDNSFVWGDGSRAFSSGAANEFRVLATNGFRFYFNDTDDHCDLTNALAGWQCFAPSDRNRKENLAPADARAIVARLATLSIQTWNYTSQDPSVRHIGPMAQDWATFGYGDNNTREISAVDANGIALAAIQGVYQIVQEKEAQIAAQQTRLSALEQRLNALEAQLRRAPD
jgi:hypothetical protein